FIVRCPRHEQGSIGCLVARRAALTGLAPVTVAMPVDEADERVVDLVHESPVPVDPEGEEALNSRPSNQRFAPTQIRSQPAQDPLRPLSIEAGVLPKADPAADPRAVGLIPHTPVPVTHHLASPLFDAAPDYIGALVGEPAHGTWIIERPAELSEGDHRPGTHVEHSLHGGCEQLPLSHRVGGTLVEEEDADDMRVDVAEPRPDLLALGPQGEVPPTVGLIYPIPQPHTGLRRVRAACRNLKLGHRPPLYIQKNPCCDMSGQLSTIAINFWSRAA